MMQQNKCVRQQHLMSVIQVSIYFCDSKTDNNLRLIYEQIPDQQQNMLVMANGHSIIIWTKKNKENILNQK